VHQTIVSFSYAKSVVNYDVRVRDIYNQLIVWFVANNYSLPGTSKGFGGSGKYRAKRPRLVAHWPKVGLFRFVLRDYAGEAIEPGPHSDLFGHRGDGLQEYVFMVNPRSCGLNLNLEITSMLGDTAVPCAACSWALRGGFVKVWSLKCQNGR
jgi:hypothetical protein